MAHLVIGAVGMAALFLLKTYVQNKGISINWWQWLLTILGLLYAVFVVELIYGFLAEGEPQAALVMGMVTGIVAVIWGILLSRFVFKAVEEN